VDLCNTCLSTIDDVEVTEGNEDDESYDETEE
jgi:hypothetical protein